MALAPCGVSQPVWPEADREVRLKAQEWEYTVQYTESDEDEDAAGGYAFRARNKIHHLHWHQCSSTQNANFTSMWRQITHRRGGNDDNGFIGFPAVFHRQGYTTCKYTLQNVETLVFVSVSFYCFSFCYCLLGLANSRAVGIWQLVWVV